MYIARNDFTFFGQKLDTLALELTNWLNSKKLICQLFGTWVPATPTFHILWISFSP